MHLRNKHNLVLYIDKQLVEKSKALGFNLSKTFENHLKHLVMQFSTVSLQNNLESAKNKVPVVGLPVPIPLREKPASGSGKYQTSGGWYWARVGRFGPKLVQFTTIGNQ